MKPMQVIGGHLSLLLLRRYRRRPHWRGARFCLSLPRTSSPCPALGHAIPGTLHRRPPSSARATTPCVDACPRPVPAMPMARGVYILHRAAAKPRLRSRCLCPRSRPPPRAPHHPRPSLAHPLRSSRHPPRRTHPASALASAKPRSVAPGTCTPPPQANLLTMSPPPRRANRRVTGLTDLRRSCSGGEEEERAHESPACRAHGSPAHAPTRLPRCTHAGGGGAHGFVDVAPLLLLPVACPTPTRLLLLPRQRQRLWRRQRLLEEKH
jgi:hypothetical protein